MKKHFKDCKKGGLAGRCAKHRLKFTVGASLLLLAVAAMCFISGSVSGMAFGTMLAFAPIAGFVLPEGVEFSENEKKGLNALAAHLSKQFDEQAKGFLTPDQLTEKINESLKGMNLTGEKLEAFEKALLEQGIALKKMQTESKQATGQSFSEQLKSFITTDEFKSGIKGQKAQAMEVKAAALMTTTNATSASHGFRYEVVPGIQEAPREATVFFPMLNKGVTSSRTIFWINRKDKEGGAAFIAEGVLKPLKDWTYEEENSVAKKIAIRTKVSMEMLNDFEYMNSEIQMMMRRDLLEKVDEKLLTGTTADEPKGILTVAGAYVGTGLDGTITEANNADAIRAGMLQMRLLNYRPDVVFMNPTDVASLDLTKSTTGNYIKIEINGVLQNIRIVETTFIDAGKYLLMDTAKWLVRVLEGLRLEFGWENDDFSKNLVSVIAEMRLHSYSNSIDEGAFVYADFATVRAALQKA